MNNDEKMTNEDSLQNLKRGVKFGEGQSIEGKGAPKGKRICMVFKEILESNASKISDKIPTGMKGRETLALELLSIAISKDHEDKLAAVKMIP